MASRPYKLDLLRGTLLALMLVNLSRIHVHLGLAQLRPALVLTVLAGAYAVARPQRLNTGKLLKQRPARIMMGLAVMACLSAAFGISLGASASFIIKDYSKVLVFGFLLIAGIRHAKDFRLMVWAYVLGAGALAYMALFVFGLENYGNYARLSNLYTFDANDIACILGAGIPLSLLLFQTSTGAKKFAAGVILMGLAAAVARSGSRGGFLALVAVGAGLLLWTPGVSAAKRVMFVAVAATGLAVATPPGYWQQIETILRPTEDYNWDSHYGRRKTAQRGIDYMVQRPLFGVGINNFPRADATLSEYATSFVDRIGQANRWRAAHNSYVQAGAETGVPGLVLWVSLILVGVFSVRRVRRSLPRAWLNGDPDRRFLYMTTVYLPIAWIGFAVASAFVSFAWADIIYILAALTAGLFTSLENLPREGHPAMAANPASTGSRARPRRYGAPRPTRPSPVTRGHVRGSIE